MQSHVNIFWAGTRVRLGYFTFRPGLRLSHWWWSWQLAVCLWKVSSGAAVSQVGQHTNTGSDRKTPRGSVGGPVCVSASPIDFQLPVILIKSYWWCGLWRKSHFVVAIFLCSESVCLSFVVRLYQSIRRLSSDLAVKELIRVHASPKTNIKAIFVFCVHLEGTGWIHSCSEKGIGTGVSLGNDKKWFLYKLVLTGSSLLQLHFQFLIEAC